MASTGVLRRAGETKEFSVWDSHRETFRRLYLLEGKSLKQVATEMENTHDFPKTE